MVGLLFGSESKVIEEEEGCFAIRHWVAIRSGEECCEVSSKVLQLHVRRIGAP